MDFVFNGTGAGKRKPSVPLAAGASTIVFSRRGRSFLPIVACPACPVVLGWNAELIQPGSPDRQKDKTLCDPGASVLNAYRVKYVTVIPN